MNNRWIQDVWFRVSFGITLNGVHLSATNNTFSRRILISWRDDNTSKDGGTQSAGKLVRVHGAIRPRKRLNTPPAGETKAPGDGENDARLDV
jgi:hypothetical protein